MMHFTLSFKGTTFKKLFKIKPPDITCSTSTFTSADISFLNFWNIIQTHLNIFVKDSPVNRFILTPTTLTAKNPRSATKIFC